jgi:hypothetical protein
MRNISYEDKFDDVRDRVEWALRKLETFGDEEEPMDARSARERYSLALPFYQSVELKAARRSPQIAPAITASAQIFWKGPIRTLTGASDASDGASVSIYVCKKCSKSR